MDTGKKPNDRYFKAAGIPVSVFLVTASYNFFYTASAINWSIADYVFLAATATLMWLGNVQVSYLARASLYKIQLLGLRLLARYGVTLLFSFFSSWILLTIWNRLLHHDVFPTNVLLRLQVIMALISLQLSSIYEIVYLNKERQSDTIKIERTEKSRLQSQLDGLKNQVDPHFIFNSLNTLSYLISQSQESARLFNDTLAKVYRYILMKKEKDLVLLKEEIEFANNYFYLLKIRYQEDLRMTIRIDAIASENYLLPPLSVQMLIENAIKHNHFSEKAPLEILISITDEKIVVTNNRNAKQFEIQSSQIGLKNLSERYQIITGNSISITEDKESFSVSLPILKT